MAPELFASETDFDPKRVDVYAFAVLLCSLWSSADPMQHFKRILEPQELWQDSDRRFKSIGDLVRGGLRPDVPPSMPAAYVALMRSCWQHEPFDRPDFGSVCAQLKRMMPASTHKPTLRCNTRIMLTVRYKPEVTPGCATRFHFEARVEDRDATFCAPMDVDVGGEHVFYFPFALLDGDARRTVYLSQVLAEEPGLWKTPSAACPASAACPVLLPATRTRL